MDWVRSIVFLSTFLGLCITIAISMLILLQLHRDRKSVVFTAITLALALLTLFSCLLQLEGSTSVFETSARIFLELYCIPLFALPVLLFVFTVEYMAAWRVSYKIVAVAFVVHYAVSVYLLLTHQWFADVSRDTNNVLTYTLAVTPLTIVLNIGVAANTWYGVYVFARQCWIKFRRHELNKYFVLGILLIYNGILLNNVYVAAQHSIGTDFMVCGALVLVQPVIRQRLFDPLTQLSNKLFRRTIQLGTITRVGQQAITLLSTDQLLQNIVKDIQAAFNYHAVTIALANSAENRLTVRAVFGQEPDGLIALNSHLPIDNGSAFGEAYLSKRVVYVDDVQYKHYTSQAIYANTCSEVSIPLVVGTPESSEILLGILDIQSKNVAAFETEEIEVLEILARQLAIAVRNAQLFDNIQQVTIAKTRFISYISHEIRNPVNNIVQNVDSILHYPQFYNGVLLPDVYKTDLVIIQDSTQQLKRLVNDILDLSKIEAGKLELTVKPCNPVSVMDQVQRETVALLKPSVCFIKDYSADLPDVLADDLRLKQVLLNLVSNACKFTSQGQVTVAAHMENREMRFAVIDTGSGIAPNEQPQLFDQFAQANKNIVREYGGTGLGLNISKQLVQLMGGRIWFESKLNHGTTFFFTLPLAEQPVLQNAG